MSYKCIPFFILISFFSQAQIFQGKSQRVLFIGNSITYAGGYVQIIEAYQFANFPQQSIEIYNLGLPSETVSGLSEEGHAGGRFPRPDLHERLARVIDQLKPNVVFATYGMNDGIYQPFDEKRFQKFKDGIHWLHKQVEASGATIIHITPSLYEDPRDKNNYEEVLDTYSKWLSSQKNWQVIDTHLALKNYHKQQRKKDPNFKFSPDGVHPGQEGHFLIAKEILRFLGVKKLKNVTSIEEILRPIQQPQVFFDLVVNRHNILKDAWLTAVGHTRPEMKKGLPISEAMEKSAHLKLKILELSR
jgi:lysophospholipase L1-like esterase